MPTSDHERFEWSICPACPFTALQEVRETYGDGNAEALLDVELVPNDFRWRVVAVYRDGTELPSATWSFGVYAFDEVDVSGTVTDKVTGNPLSSVHLELMSGPANWVRNTGPSGTFDFKGGPGGPEPPTLTASKAGYETQVIPLAVGESAVVDVELTPTP